MIDVTAEQPLSLKEACNLPFLRRGGKPLHLATLHRWATSGIKGNKLETVNYPQGMRTTAEAVLRFLGAMNGQPAGRPTRSRRARAIADAERELDAAHIT